MNLYFPSNVYNASTHLETDSKAVCTFLALYTWAMSSHSVPSDSNAPAVNVGQKVHQPAEDLGHRLFFVS